MSKFFHYYYPEANSITGQQTGAAVYPGPSVTHFADEL